MEHSVARYRLECEAGLIEPVVSDLFHRALVSRQLGIGSEKRDAFRNCLGQKEAIEGIFVKRREAVDVGRMLPRDGKLDVSVVEQAAAQYTRVSMKVIPTERVLDRDFPDARGAEVELIFPIAQLPARGGGQPVWLTGCPEKELGVEEKLQSSSPKSLAISFPPIVLKSRGTAISPERKPSR